MNAINITTGKITIPVVRDGESVGEISFNPYDAAFAERYQQLVQAVAGKQEEVKKSEESGPALFVDACKFVKAQIDHVFGDGSSQILFGDANSLEMFNGFFEGLTPVFQQARAEKLSKYLGGNKNESTD